MTAKENQDFVTYNGDDVYPIFTVYGSDLATVVDISTVTEITWFVKRNLEEAILLTKLKSLAQIVFVTNGTDGKFAVTVTKTDTAALDGYYIHFAKITDALGNVTTIECGRMRVGPRPKWTYDPNDLTTDLYAVRRLIGDVIANDQQVWDGEILWALTQRANVYGAGALVCQSMAAQFSRKVDTTSPGGLSTSYGKVADAYAKRAKELEAISAGRGAGIEPFMGGISVQSKVQFQLDSDRVQPAFNIGMTDNLTIPVSPVGNETPTQPMGGGGVGSGGL